MLLSLAQNASADVGVRVNGSEVDFSPAPIVEAGRVFVPLRGVFERLGASVDYSDGEINAQGHGRDISLHIGATQASVNGQSEILDVAPFIVGASTYVPLRFISEALGASVNYDASDDVVSIAMAGVPQAYSPPSLTNYDNDGSYASYAPPPIPSYAQPYVPEPNEIWQPGYWAWGPYGYYWVPGTWVAAPQTGYLWTPGYWHYDNSRYAWSPGFWAVAVGFYGGVNYGGGYGGRGYDGGRWQGRTFQYNTYVTRVNSTIVHDTYVNRTVVIDNRTTRVSYNGGADGLQARPTEREIAVTHARHLGVTSVQVQHLKVAEQDRQLLATVNHDNPPVVAVAHPLTSANRPASFEPVKQVVRFGVHAPPVAPQTRVAPIAAPRTQPVAPKAEPERVAPDVVRTPVETLPKAFAPRDETPPKAIAPAPAAPVVHTAPVLRPQPAHQYAPPVEARPNMPPNVVRPRAIVRPPHVIPPPPHASAERPVQESHPADVRARGEAPPDEHRR